MALNPLMRRHLAQCSFRCTIPIACVLLCILKKRLISRVTVAGLSTSSSARAIAPFNMPSMSPTMEQGKISQWKVKQGDAFKAGDVLLCPFPPSFYDDHLVSPQQQQSSDGIAISVCVLTGVETDKAEIDVEAQDDGILGKILKQDGEGDIPVGQPIAFLAEEGDDLSQIPESAQQESPTQKKEEPQASSGETEQNTQQESKSLNTSVGASHHLSHDLVHGLKPSVQRLLLSSSSVSESSLRQFLSDHPKPSKGDALAFLGRIPAAEGSLTPERLSKISMSPYGADGKPKNVSPAAAGQAKKEEPKEEPLDAAGLRRVILSGMAFKAKPKAPVAPKTVGKPAGTGAFPPPPHSPTTFSCVRSS